MISPSETHKSPPLGIISITKDLFQNLLKISPRETHKRHTLYIISITKDLYENFKANLYRAIYMYVIIYWFPLSWDAHS